MWPSAAKAGGKEALRKNEKDGKIFISCICGFCFAVSLCGCSGVDPEKRLYPLAMSVDYENGQYRVIYGMADLPGATGQDKPEEGESAKIVSLSGRNFQEIDSEYDRSREKYLDISHLQALILGKTSCDRSSARRFSII